ncbi:MAG: DUF4446 family protein [Candidatus Limnocylindrales bacterium]
MSLAAPAVVLIAATIVLSVAACLVVTVRIGRRLRDVEGRIGALTAGADGRSLEEVLDLHLATVHAVAGELGSLTARIALLEVAGRRAFQRVGLVRYNPFEETGGNQSFALALLDADDDGFVLTTLHARSGTRVYARALAAGRAEGSLSAEESEALELARSATKGRPAIADHGTEPQRTE